MKSIKLRQATIDDAKDLFRWKNDPITRKFSILTKEKIKWEDHLKYLSGNIGNFQIIIDGENSLGAIRITDEIAVWVDQRYRGQRVAYRALLQVIKPGMIAKIVNGNISSFRLFISLGFKPITYNEGYYILRK